MCRPNSRKRKVEQITAILPEGLQTIKIDLDEAQFLCDTGHARWKKSNLILILPNIPMGPGLSLRVGADLATDIFSEDVPTRNAARLAVTEIISRKGV